jgi:membrane protease YdiL (CAAX protease family)
MSDRRVVTFSTGAVLSFSGVYVFSLTLPDVESAWALSISALGMELFLMGIALGGASVSHENPTLRLGLASGRLSLGSIAVLALGTLALSHGIDGILQVTGLREHSAIAEIDDQLRGAQGGTLVLAIIGIGIAPGIAEELLCRGWIQRGLEPRLGAPGAIVVASILFGVLHGDLVHAAAAAGLGLYLGIVAWLAASIRASILCHAANNLTAVLTLAWDIPTGLASIWTMPLGLGVAGGCLLVVWRNVGAPRSRAGASESEASEKLCRPDE